MSAVQEYRPETFELIREWCLVGETADNSWLRFTAFYLCLNVAMATESGKVQDKQMVDSLCERLTASGKGGDGGHGRDPLVKSLKASLPGMAVALTRLLKSTPIHDSRPGSSQESSLSSVGDLQGLIRCLYRIRCNLFHGRKNPEAERDRQLVSTAAGILWVWMPALVRELEGYDALTATHGQALDGSAIYDEIFEACRDLRTLPEMCEAINQVAERMGHSDSDARQDAARIQAVLQQMHLGSTAVSRQDLQLCKKLNELLRLGPPTPG